MTGLAEGGEARVLVVGAGAAGLAAAREAATPSVQGFHAARMERAGTLGLLRAEEASDRVGGDHLFRVTGGYSRVAEWLSAEVAARGGRVQLNTVAREVRWGRRRV